MVEKAEDIIYYEETISDGTTWYRCDYKGVAIRKPKSMFDGRRQNFKLNKNFLQYKY